MFEVQIQLLESFRPVSLLEAGACFANLFCGLPIHVPRTPETLQLPEHGLANFVSWRLTAHPILLQGRYASCTHPKFHKKTYL